MFVSTHTGWRLRLHRGRSTLISPPLLSSHHRKLGSLREVAHDNIVMYQRDGVSSKPTHEGPQPPKSLARVSGQGYQPRVATIDAPPALCISQSFCLTCHSLSSFNAAMRHMTSWHHIILSRSIPEVKIVTISNMVQP